MSHDIVCAAPAASGVVTSVVGVLLFCNENLWACRPTHAWTWGVPFRILRARAYKVLSYYRFYAMGNANGTKFLFCGKKN